MMNHLRLVAVAGICAAATYIWTPRAEAQASSDVLPGCSIPRSFGRLVSIAGGGGTGEAVFEGEDGTIRFVPFMPNSMEVIAPKPFRSAPKAIFPPLPVYECTTGNVWRRY